MQDCRQACYGTELAKGESMGKWCVTYTDLRDGSTYARVEKQTAGESYNAFAARMLRPGFDWPWSDCVIMDIVPAVRRGILPVTALD
jgi:hypothetical protein